MELNGLETAEIALSLDRNQLQRKKGNETYQKRYKMNKNNLKRNQDITASDYKDN